MSGLEDGLGGDAVDLLEDAGEVIGVRKADGLGHLLDERRRAVEQVSGVAHLQPDSANPPADLKAEFLQVCELKSIWDQR